MIRMMEEYEAFLVEVKRASENTVCSYMRDLRQFEAYLSKENIPFDCVERQTVSQSWRAPRTALEF